MDRDAIYVAQNNNNALAGVRLPESVSLLNRHVAPSPNPCHEVNQGESQTDSFFQVVVGRVG